MQTPRTEFAQALRAIASERGLDPSVIIDTIKQAIIAAYKKDVKERLEEVEGFEYEVELNPTSGEAKILAWEEGKEDDKKDVTPPGFGRIAAQTAKQVIHQKIREAEKGAIIDEYSGRVGSLISGLILRFEGNDVRVDLGKTEGIMPSQERVPNERLTPSARMTFLLKDVQDGLKGKQVILSRADPMFVQKLFEREVPEMSSGSIEVKAIVREPGLRTKIAVFSKQSGVDPVGSCVGQKGVRVQAVTNELGGERVDIIQWSENTTDLIKAALSPAEGLMVNLNGETQTALVKAPEDQLSMAIGRDGQNARLAAKLVGWGIKIEEIQSTTEDKKKKKEDVVDDQQTPVQGQQQEEKIQIKEKGQSDQTTSSSQVSDDSSDNSKQSVGDEPDDTTLTVKDDEEKVDDQQESKDNQNKDKSAEEK